MAVYDSTENKRVIRELEEMRIERPLSSEIKFNFIDEEDHRPVGTDKLRVALAELSEQRARMKRCLADETLLLSSYKKECQNLTKQLEDLQKENAALKEESHQTEEESSRLARDLELLTFEEKQLEEAIRADSALNDLNSLLRTATGIQWEDSSENEASGVIITPHNMKPFGINLKEKSHAYAKSYIWNLLEEEVLNKTTEE